MLIPQPSYYSYLTEFAGGVPQKTGLSPQGGSMTLHHIASRVRIRNGDDETPFGIDGPPDPGGGFSYGKHQVYAVMLDDDSAPMVIFERWLERA